MKIKLDLALCRAIAMDAGNRSQRRARRTAWNRDDYNVAAIEFARLVSEAKEEGDDDTSA